VSKSRLRAALFAISSAAIAAIVAIALVPPVPQRAGAAPPPAGTDWTFNYTGGPQLFTVPDGVTFLTMDAIGGRGGFPNQGGAPGAGGETIAGFDVTSGQQLTIWVGANAGGGGGWGYTCGGDHGIATSDPPVAFDGGGGGGSSAVTDGAWSSGAGTCDASTRPASNPLAVGGGGGGGGGREHIPLTDYQGGDGGAGGSPAQAGFPGQGADPGPGGCVGCGPGNHGGRGVSQSDNETNTLGGGGGGGGGYVPPGSGNGGGGGGQLPSGNGNTFGGGGGAGGTSFAAPNASNPIFVAGPLNASGVVTLSTVHQQGFDCTGGVQNPSIPSDVQYAHVTVEGGAGGKRSGSNNDAPPGAGGHAGIVSADLNGFAWDKLDVYVGCHGTDGSDGGGGFGYGKGGGKGHADGPFADNGAGGGGGSALEIGGFAVVVAGGGGGGGGGAQTLGITNGGGDGGDGGNGTQPNGGWGHDGDGGSIASGGGGCPGTHWPHTRHATDGITGDHSSTADGGGGGGGGGGGWGGACGGGGGGAGQGGGGGGGGGGSYALPHTRAVTGARYSTSTGVGTDGNVVFSYHESTPAHVTVVGGSGQQTPIGTTFEKPLQAKVLDQSGRPLLNIPVQFTIPDATPGAPSGTFAGGGDSVTVDTDVNGVASSPALTANDEVGSWQVQASVDGDAPPADFSLTNTALPTATSMSSSVNPAVAGQTVAFTATVKTPSGGLEPTGTVQFSSDGQPLGAPVALTNGVAQSAPTALPLGSHTIEAAYQPDDGFQPSSATLTEVVEKEKSSTTVTSSENPSGFGDPVTFTATVTPGPPGVIQPTGTVQFSVDGQPLGAAVPLSDGKATSPSIDTLTLGAHSIEAAYSGDAFVDPSAGKLTQSVGPDATATEVSSSPNPSVYGQPVTYTATVKAHGVDTPTGSVTFLIDGNQACNATLANGTAMCQPGALLDAGSHDVIVQYPGNADFQGSSGSATHQVTRATTNTGITSSVNPSVFGQAVTFTAHVTVPPPGGGAPTGSVQFLAGSQPLGGPVPVSGGTAVSAPVTSLPVGVDAVSAQYLGDANHSVSGETLFQDVGKGQTATTVTSSLNPSIFGIPVTFTAQVEPSPPANGAPQGTVRFTIDGKAACDTPVAGGAATCAAPTLFTGDHQVVADYSGDADFSSSTDTLEQNVVKVPSHTTLDSSANPSQSGQPVAFTANVLGGLPGESPAGTVTFADGTTTLATVGVHATLPGAGAATFETDALAAGSHEIVATYSGDDAIDPSVSAPVAQTVEGPLTPLEPPSTTTGTNSSGSSGSASRDGSSGRGVLAFTGSTLAWLVIGLALLALGLLLTLAARRRRRSAHS
jgi:hypothetical protein